MGRVFFQLHGNYFFVTTTSARGSASLQQKKNLNNNMSSMLTYFNDVHFIFESVLQTMNVEICQSFLIIEGIYEKN